MAKVLVWVNQGGSGEDLRLALSNSGHEILVAQELAQVVQLVGERGVEAVVFDLPSNGALSPIRALRQSYPLVPLILVADHASLDLAKEGMRLGASDLISRPPRPEELLKSVELAIRGVSDLEERVDQLSVFNEIAKLLNSTLKLREVLKITMEKIAELIKAEAWSIALVDETTGELVFEAAVGEKGERVRDLRLKKGQGIAGWVVAQGKPLIVPDVARDPRHFPGFDQKTEFVTRSILAVPLI